MANTGFQSPSPHTGSNTPATPVPVANAGSPSTGDDINRSDSPTHRSALTADNARTPAQHSPLSFTSPDVPASGDFRPASSPSVVVQPALRPEGQTIPNVGVYLPESVFSHDQLYVALSRGISRKKVKVLVRPTQDFPRPGLYTSNVCIEKSYMMLMHSLYKVTILPWLCAREQC